MYLPFAVVISEMWEIPIQILTVLKRRRSAAEVPWIEETISMILESLCRDDVGRESVTAGICREPCMIARKLRKVVNQSGWR
jgi:hypothetical protein